MDKKRDNPFTIYPFKLLSEIPPLMTPPVSQGRTVSDGAFHLHPRLSSVPMPGVRCPTCEAQGIETWVIQGQNCHVCGTACN
ncbi:hypothetical protein VTN31DRAFT_3546 [Thermomyces dupontii]|uniref:uncharacterized protein n=1 Tax=Talaromyces thermophilus TaxID=28565 RepID=UPI003743B338